MRPGAVRTWPWACPRRSRRTSARPPSGCVGLLRPERAALTGVLAFAVVSVALSAVGPKILGRATDLIFAGRHRQAAARRCPPSSRWSTACAPAATTPSPTCSRPWTSCPGRASTSGPWAGCCCWSWPSTPWPRVLSWAQGWILTGAVNRTIFNLRRDVEDKLSRLPLPYFDAQPRGELLSRVTNDIDNVAQSLQQTLSQLLTSLLTVVAMVAMMFVISPLLALIALVTIPISVVGHRGHRQAVAAPLRPAVEEHRRAQLRRGGDVHRARPGQGLRPPATRRRRPSPPRTTTCMPPGSALSSSAASSCRR